MSQPAVSAKHVAFIYADDLWVADFDGKNPRRLTTDIGVESYPVFSPDGQTIAFSAQYDGNTDVYTIPLAGGIPTRLTSHPSADTRSRVHAGWEDRAVLVASECLLQPPLASLHCSPDGGMPTQLPIPWGFEAAYSPDGEFIAYTPVRDASSQWKHYRGGTHSRIWIYNVKTHDVVEIPQPKERCNDLDPNWVGNTHLLPLRSRRRVQRVRLRHRLEGGEADHPATPTSRSSTSTPTARSSSSSRPATCICSVRANRSHRGMKIGVAIDGAEARARYAKGSKYVRDVSISPSGSRAVVEFRGEIVTVPAEKGDARNLTNSPGVHERNPAWSPDGKTIAYFSDEGGEYQLVLAPQNGKGEAANDQLTGTGFYSDPVWSRDSKKLLYRDNSAALYWLDVESGKITQIVEPQHGLGRGLKLVELVAGLEVGDLRDQHAGPDHPRLRLLAGAEQVVPDHRRLDRSDEPGLRRERQVPVLPRLDRHRHEQARLQPVGRR